MRLELILPSDPSTAYWTIELIGTTTVAMQGHGGARPRATRKHFDTVEDAQRAIDKQVASKRRKGYVDGEAPAHEEPEWSVTSMSESVFWQLIGRLEWEHTGDDEAVVEPVVSALATMSDADIFRFEDFLAEKLHTLDTEAHAREAGENSWGSGDYFSADFFLYTRCCVVANGRTHFERVLATPARMPEDMEFEALLNVASAAYERKTGEDFPHSAAVDYETFANEAGWPNLENEAG